MAAVITCAIQQGASPNLILGRRHRLVVAVSNSDATTAASVTSIQLVARPSNLAISNPPVVFPIGRSTQVPVSSTIYFPCSVVVQGPQTQGTSDAETPQLAFTLSAIVTCDDASVCVSPLFSIAPSMPMPSSAAAGQARFDQNPAGPTDYTLPAVLGAYAGVGIVSVGQS